MSHQKMIEDYIANLEGWQAEMAKTLDRIILETVPNARMVIKWKQPTYEDHGLLCYFKAFRSHINLGFFRGNELDDPDGLLEGTGEKMRHIKLDQQYEMDENAIKRLILSAAKLNHSYSRV